MAKACPKAIGNKALTTADLRFSFYLQRHVELNPIKQRLIGVRIGAQRSNTAADLHFTRHSVMQRAVILATLRRDHPDDWTQSELEQTLDMTSEVLIDALIDLEANNVIDCVDGFIRASPCARHLDALGLIAS